MAALRSRARSESRPPSWRPPRRASRSTCSDSAHTRRETYIGPWLPSPVDTSNDPTLGAERAEALELATLLLMERLTPTERAAYVLREAFVYPYSRIAEIVETTEAAARQLVSRARKHLAGDSRRGASRDAQRSFFRAFLDAARTGDTAALEGMLATDAVSYTDGGGVVHRTARRPIRGREKLVRFLFGVSKWFWGDVTLRPVEANGRRGRASAARGAGVRHADGHCRRDAVSQIMWIMNPAKLAAIAPEVAEQRQLVGA